MDEIAPEPCGFKGSVKNVLLKSEPGCYKAKVKENQSRQSTSGVATTEATLVDSM